MQNTKILTWFNFFLGFYLYGPIAILYFSKVSNSFALGMSIFSVIMISAAIFEVPTGIFSDRIGRKNTIVLGALVGILAVILYGIGGSYLILVAGAILEGLSRFLYSGNNNALLYDSLLENDKKDEFHNYLGKMGSAEQFSLALAALVGGVLASYSFSLAVRLSLIPMSICFILALFLTEPKVHSKKSGNVFSHLKEALYHFRTNKKLRLLTFAGMVDYGLGETSHQFQPAFVATLWPVWAIGFMRAAGNALASISFWFSGQLINRFTAIKLLITSEVYVRIVGLIAYLANNVVSPLLLATTSAFHGIVTVSYETLNQKEFTNEQRATMGSLNSLFGSLFFGVCAFIVGLIADSAGPTKSLLVLEILKFSVIIFYWKLFKHERTVATN